MRSSTNSKRRRSLRRLGLGALLAAAGPAFGAGGDAVWTAASSAVWHSNATNADRDPDVIGGFELKNELLANRRWSAGRDDAVFAGLRLATETWGRYDGLDRASAGIALGWQRKFGLGSQVPALRLNLTGDRVEARESGRRGLAGTAALQLRQRLGHWGLLQLAREYQRHDARTHAFDRTGAETAARFTFAPRAGWRLTLGAARRDGGVLSYATPPHPELLRKAKPLTTVTTFDRAQDMVAYYFIARTESARAEAGFSLGPRTEFVCAHERRSTSKGVVAYRNHLTSLSIVHEF